MHGCNFGKQTTQGTQRHFVCWEEKAVASADTDCAAGHESCTLFWKMTVQTHLTKLQQVSCSQHCTAGAGCRTSAFWTPSSMTMMARVALWSFFTSVHKTGRSASKKATLLPILCPAVGVTGSNWVNPALQAFDKVGLKFSGNIQGPLLRPPSHEGSFLCNRNVNATEVGRLLRGLIGLDVCCCRCQLSTCECAFT